MTRLRRRIRVLPEVVLAWLAWLILPYLPRGAILALARGGGRLVWHVAARERRISLANLDLVYGATRSPREKQAIGVASFQHFALTMLDLFWFSRFAEDRYRRYVQKDGHSRASLREAPMIGVTGHIGNWEILSATCGMEGNPMMAVAMPLKNRVVDRLLYRLRIGTGSRPIPRSGAVRSLLRCLRASGAVGLLLDQNTLPEEGGVFVPFFGLAVPVSNAAGLLAVKTGAPLLASVAVADEAGVYRIETSDVLRPSGLSAEAITAEMTARLETLIRAHPEHWLWSYKRWRYYRREDTASRYPNYARCIGNDGRGIATPKI